MKRTSSTFAAVSGDGYELAMGRWSRRIAGPFLDFAGLTDAGTVLDAGCGTGSLSAELLRRTGQAKITAIDISPAYVAHAKAAVPGDRITFDTGDLTALSFADGSFDQVFSQLVLHFVPDAERAVSELVRVTKPGGMVAAAVWDARGGLLFNRFFLDTAAMLDPKAGELRGRDFTRPMTRPGELAKAWEGAGLIDRRAGEATIRADFASFADYWAPYDGDDGPIPVYLNSMTPELRGSIKNAVRRAYLDGEEDGPRSYTATAWLVVGTRPAASS